MDTARFEVPTGFGFEATVRSHGWYLLAPFRWNAATATLHRAERLGGTVHELAISRDGGALVVASDRSLRGRQRELAAKIDRIFQLRVDTSEFAAMAAGTESHAWIATTRFGRLLCSPTRFEDAVKIIATTNTTWRQTMRMVELLVLTCGSRSRSGAAAFPDPGQIAATSPEVLQRECRLGYRAKTIHALAAGVVSGTIELDALCDPTLPAREQLAQYRSLPGIGPYGAAHLMALDGRHDFIAVDTEFRRFVRERYHRGRAVADATLLRRYRRWGRWQYLAYWSELWRDAAGALVKFEKGDE